MAMTFKRTVMVMQTAFATSSGEMPAQSMLHCGSRFLGAWGRSASREQTSHRTSEHSRGRLERDLELEIAFLLSSNQCDISFHFVPALQSSLNSPAQTSSSSPPPP